MIAAHVERARAEVSDAFRQIFDVALVEAHEKLLATPGDLSTKVRFVTLYHLVLESTLGLTTFKFVTDYLNDERLLPGFVEGYSKIHHDETRHIGYGVWFLRETCARPPRASRLRPRDTPRAAALRGRIAQAARRQRKRLRRRFSASPKTTSASSRWAG